MRAVVSEIIWRPTPDTVAGARITAFLRRCGALDVDELCRRAAADPGWFWGHVADDLGIDWFEPPQQVLDLSEGVAWPQWFRGARLNLAHECLDKHVASGRGAATALVYEGEDGTVRQHSYAELLAESGRLAAGLRSLGVGKGDRVGIFLPMLPETAVVMLAVARLGAIFTPIFSGFAAGAAASRLADAGARVLVTADGFARRGALVRLKETADAAAEMAGCVEHLVVVRRTGCAVPWTEGRDRWYHEVTAGPAREPADGTGLPAGPARGPAGGPGLPAGPGTGPDAAPVPPAERMEPDDPFMIIYTSGTTGSPKGAVHTHGGFPIKAAQEMAHLFDLREQERFFWYSDPGWMMGPWLILGTLMLGATMFLYDGAPDYPAPDRIWAMAARHRITHLALAPTVVRALSAHGEQWPAAHDLSALRILAGAGEPWNPEPYRWYFRHVGRERCPILNYSGGTEVSGGILGSVVTRPLKPCSFNTVVPGMAAALLDEQGRPVAPGQVGELCLTAPFVGMTRGFWQDQQRYLEAYWSRFDGVWVHGDWASCDADGFWYIHGRADDTIKIAGKRVGPAEVESVLVGDPRVVEAAAVGVPHPVKGESLVCFVVAAPGAPVTEGDLTERVIRAMGRPLAPERVLFVGGLPKTRTGKVMRRVLRAAYLGQDPGDLSSLENPDVLQHFQRRD